MAKKKQKYDVKIGSVTEVPPKYDVQIGDIEPSGYNVQVGQVVPQYELAPMEFELGPEKQQDPYAESILKMIEAKKSRRQKIQDLDARIAAGSPQYHRGYESMLFDDAPPPSKPAAKQINPAAILRNELDTRDAELDRQARDSVLYTPYIGSKQDNDGLIPLPKDFVPEKGKGVPRGIRKDKVTPDILRHLGFTEEQIEEYYRNEKLRQEQQLQKQQSL
jgi:hypothetical protein